MRSKLIYLPHSSLTDFSIETRHIKKQFSARYHTLAGTEAINNDLRTINIITYSHAVWFTDTLARKPSSQPRKALFRKVRGANALFMSTINPIPDDDANTETQPRHDCLTSTILVFAWHGISKKHFRRFLIV